MDQASIPFKCPQAERRRPYQSAEDDQWLARCIEIERARPPIRVVRVRMWHPALDVLRSKLEAAAREGESAQRAFDKERARSAKSARSSTHQPSQAALRLHWATGPGGVLLDTHKASAIRVTLGTFERALLVLNAIFLAADARAVRAQHDEPRGKFVLRFEGADIEFAIRERLEEKWREKANSWNGETKTEKYLAPTGRLFIAVYMNGYDSRQFPADKDGNFDDLSGILFDALYRRVVLCHQAMREQAALRRSEEARQLELAELERRREEEEAVLEEQTRLSAIECVKERSLLEEARRWEDANVLRRYLHARLQTATDTSLEWLCWAQAVANRLDSTLNPHSPGSDALLKCPPRA